MNWGPLDLQSNALPLSYTPLGVSRAPTFKKNPILLFNIICKIGFNRPSKLSSNFRKFFHRERPDLNQGPLDLQSNALPLSYTPI